MKKELNTSELLKKVRKIEISIRGYVHELFAGEYHSVFKGQGMEFAEVREYAPGDDIRNIDWNVTARMNHPYVKQFNEERELSVLFLFDGSMSQHFATRGDLKKNIGIEISAVLTSAALLNNDKVGLYIYTDIIEKMVPIRKGKKHILRLIRELLAFQPEQKGTSLKNALEYAHHLLKKRTTIFIISDFWEKGFETPLKIVAKKHDVIALHLIDPMELKFPEKQLIKVIDPETGEQFIVDTFDNYNASIVQKKIQEHFLYLDEIFKKNKIDKLNIMTNEDYIIPLVKFFKKREKRFR